MRANIATPDEQAYREDTVNTNHSALRLFNSCPNLYYEQCIAKTYEEPEKDYFVYGSLVDRLLTAPHELEKFFVRVERQLDPSDALKYEQKIKELTLEMEIPDKKGSTMIERAESGNKTAKSGIEKREREIEDLRGRLTAIKELGQKQQVTNAMWLNAHATAEAIKCNPFFQELKFDEFSSQQAFTDPVARRKGMLDYVRFSPPAQKLYASFKAGLLDRDALRVGISELSPSSRKGRIVDIKTTYLLSEFEPKMYATQLAIYQRLVEALTGIVCECFIIAGDKDTNCKRAQDYQLAQPLLDRAWGRYLQVEAAFRECEKTGVWPSAKELWGTKQECFRCSICKDRPFSFDKPLLVNGPLFY